MPQQPSEDEIRSALAIVYPQTVHSTPVGSFDQQAWSSYLQDHDKLLHDDYHGITDPGRRRAARIAQQREAERSERWAAIDRAYGTEPPERTWAGRVADSLKHGAFRFGLGTVDNYLAHDIENDKKETYHRYLAGGYNPEEAQKLMLNEIVRRLYGGGMDRGDLYEHEVARNGSMVSSSWLGRLLGAYQHQPTRVGSDGTIVGGETESISMADYRATPRSHVPGLETALDFGSYAVPYLGGAIIAKDVLTSLQDGNYGTAAGMALLGPVSRGASKGVGAAGRAMSRIGIPVNGATKAVGSVSRTVTPAAAGIGTMVGLSGLDGSRE